MKTAFRVKKPVVATSLRFGQGGSRVVAGNGEINASSVKELLQLQQQFLAMASEGNLKTEEDAIQDEEIAKLRREMVTASFSNREAHAELGAKLGDSLFVAANREGFARRFLLKLELTQGMIPRAKLRMKNVTAVVAGSPTNIESQIVRDNTLYLTEFDIIARPFIEEREIQQSQDDVLEEKFIEAQEALMVREDRLWKYMSDATVGTDNDLTYVGGSFTLASITAVKEQVTRWNIPATSLLMASDLAEEFASNPQVAANIDPVSQHELLLTGKLGVIYGMSVMSDAYRHKEHKVLNRGEFYVVGAPENHGCYSDRGGISSTPIDISIEKKNGRGWVLAELYSCAVSNGRSVAKGVRV